MLKTGSIILSIWSGINFLLAALILTSVVIFNANSPLLVMVFEKHEIASLDTRVIASTRKQRDGSLFDNPRLPLAKQTFIGMMIMPGKQ